VPLRHAAQASSTWCTKPPLIGVSKETWKTAPGLVSLPKFRCHWLKFQFQLLWIDIRSSSTRCQWATARSRFDSRFKFHT